MNENDIFKRYKKSIIIDNLLVVISSIILIAILSSILGHYNNIFGFIFFGSFIFSGAIFLLFSDVIFWRRSLGKRIYNIQINMNKKIDAKTYIAICLYRRFLEATIHPWDVRSFKEKAKLIDEKTNTEIIYIKKVE
jgi:hypothetical protein